MDVFCVLRCRICSLHQYFEGTCCIHVQTEATLTLKMEAARSKVTPLVICDPTRCQDPEEYHLVYICSGGLETSRINVCALVCLSFVLSVCPFSIPPFNYGHQYYRYDFSQLAAKHHEIGNESTSLRCETLSS